MYLHIHIYVYRTSDVASTLKLPRSYLGSRAEATGSAAAVAALVGNSSVDKAGSKGLAALIEGKF